MKGIFISYRREDSAPYAGRVCDHLRRTFPSTSVFMDIDAVALGADFVNAIDSNLSQSAVVLAVIGPQWESVRDLTGRRRIENPEDYVARELSAALQRQTNVIPLLVGGAKMPATTNLPSQLADLTRRNAIEISDVRFAADAERLCKAISHLLGIQQDDQHLRVEYSQFFSDAALAKAWSRFRLAVWLSYALTVLLISFGLVTSGVDRKVSSSDSTMHVEWLPCGDAKSTDGDLCRAVSRALGEAAGEMTELADKAVPVITVLLVGLWALVNLKLLRGRNWARIAFTALGGIVAISAFEAVFFSRLQGAAYVASAALIVGAAICYGWAVRMMFTEPVRRWFLRA